MVSQLARELAMESAVGIIPSECRTSCRSERGRHTWAHPWRHAVMPCGGIAWRIHGGKVESLQCAPVAQMDRACASEAQGQRFESSRARHFFGSILPKEEMRHDKPRPARGRYANAAFR